MKKIKVALYFPPKEIKEPITYHLVKEYDLKINILHADINLNKEGKLILNLSGLKNNIEKGLEFLESLGVKYKLFTKSIIWQEDGCIHCGACTAVCPSNALTMDGDTLTFDKEKCMLCELCVKACPLNVISVGF